MTRKRSAVTENDAHSAGAFRASPSLFLDVDALRLPEPARAAFESWGRSLSAFVHRCSRRWPEPFVGPQAVRLAVAALGRDMRRLARVAEEIESGNVDGAGLLRRVELTRLRLGEMAAELEAEATSSSASVALEEELVNVGL